jgi:hypothetical protein
MRSSASVPRALGLLHAPTAYGMRRMMHVIACPSHLRYTSAALILPPPVGEPSEGTRRHMPLDRIHRQPPTHAALRLFALAALLAALGILLSMPRLPAASAAAAAPARHLGSSDPVIVWDSSMIFPGQNSGNPWGPVGEHAGVHGQHFPDGHYNLVLAPGDVNNDATVCSSGTIPVGSPVTASGGGFSATFDWPAAANSLNTAYSICALNAADNNVASHLDSGPFTVLAANPPSLSVLTTSLKAGDSINVSGQNWVPEQQVLVSIGPCQSCAAQKTASATVTSTGHNTGTFSATLTVPASTAAGTYYLGAANANRLLSAPSQTLTITASPTATATATATATTTPAATATAVSAGRGGSPGSGSSVGLVFGLVIAGIVLLAVLAGLLAFLLTRRPAPADGVGGGGRTGIGPAPGAYPTARPHGAAPPPLPMPDEDERQGAWDPGVTTATSSAEDVYPGNYDDPTDPGLDAPRNPRR